MYAMTKQWLDMGLRPRAVTRDLDWGIPLPLEGEEWSGKCIYVWFEAVQGTTLVLNYGLKGSQILGIGKSGGRYQKMALNQGTYTSLVKTTFRSIQLSGQP